MKKRVGFISLDSTFAQWLWETLESSVSHTQAERELWEGLRDLMGGSMGLLMLELGEVTAAGMLSAVARFPST